MRNEVSGGVMRARLLMPILSVLALAPLIVTAQQQAGDQSESLPADTDPASTRQVESVDKPVKPAPRFTPSEKIRADDAVSFPVDI